MKRSISLVVLSILVVAALGCDRRYAGFVADAVTAEPIVGAMVAVADDTGTVWQAVTGADGGFDVAVPSTRPQVMTVDHGDYLARTFAAQAGEALMFGLTIDPDPGDADGDGLTNGEEAAFGTDPGDADTDRDWHADGIEAKVSAPLGLPGLGAKPLRKSAFLEIDWAAGYPSTQPSAFSTEPIEQAFRQAPVSNPDGSTGIDLLIDRGDHGGGSGIDIGVWDCDYGLDNPPPAVLDGLAPERRDHFFHAIAPEGFECADIRGVAIRNGALLLYDGSQYEEIVPLSEFIEGLTIMHEFGHNLGLDHGWPYCKPNYPSVMNYNVIASLRYEYSTGSRPTLDEHSLHEYDGIGDGPIDWNDNGVLEPGAVAADVNNHKPWGVLGDLVDQWFTGRCDPDGILEGLADENDWSEVDLIPNFTPYASPALRSAAGAEVIVD